MKQKSITRITFRTGACFPLVWNTALSNMVYCPAYTAIPASVPVQKQNAGFSLEEGIPAWDTELRKQHWAMQASWSQLDNQVSQEQDSHGSLGDAGQLLATTHCCCSNPATSRGAQPTLVGARTGLRGLWSAPTTAKAPTTARETLPETRLSILYSDVLSPLPMEYTWNQRENSGGYFLRKDGKIARDFFGKVNAQDLKAQSPNSCWPQYFKQWWQ